MPSPGIEGFEHLHRHTHGSLQDGYATPDEYAERSPKVNQKYLCVTDHGAMGMVPSQIAACEKLMNLSDDDKKKGKKPYDLQPIFGCELYINPLQPMVEPGKKTKDYVEHMSEADRKSMQTSSHLLAIAYNETGYSNLVRMSSWGWLYGFYRRPRINYEVLQAHKEGIIFTSCCISSEIGRAFCNGGAAEADSVLERYIAMIGKENFRLEIMLLDYHKQKPYDIYIIGAASKYGLEVIVTQDCHYCNPEDSKFQQYMLMCGSKKTIRDIEMAQQKSEAEGGMADIFELQDTNLWMKSEEELNDKWLKDYSQVIEYDVFAQAKRNTVKICEMAKGVKLDRSIKLPTLPDDEAKLKEAVIKGFKWRHLPHTKQYLDRLFEEYALICQKGFASYFLIEKMMADEGRRWYGQKYGGEGSEAIGPGRGSGVGSLTLYCLGVTDVNPIDHDLLFSRFLSPARGGKQMKLRFSIDPVPA